MKLKQLIDVGVKNGNAKGEKEKPGVLTIFAKERNYIQFLGSNLTTSATPGINHLSSISLEAPLYLRSGIIALRITEVGSKGETLSSHKSFLHIGHNGMSELIFDLERTFEPKHDRMAHIEGDTIVAKVGDKLVASNKKEGALLADATTLCRWIAEEIPDQALMLTITERIEEEAEYAKAKKLVQQLEAELQQCHKAMERKDAKITTILGDLEDCKLQIHLLQEENARLKNDKLDLEGTLVEVRNQLFLAKDAINQIYTRALDCWFLPKKLKDLIYIWRSNKIIWPDK